jgi:hypothetical protein
MSHSLEDEKFQPRAEVVAAPPRDPPRPAPAPAEQKSQRLRIRELIWDTLDSPPDERRLVRKIDIFILCGATPSPTLGRLLI